MMDGWAQSKKLSDTGGANDDGPTAGITAFNHVPGGSNVLYMDGHVKPASSAEPVPYRQYGHDAS